MREKRRQTLYCSVLSENSYFIDNAFIESPGELREVLFY